MQRRYQNSICLKQGWLHDFEQLDLTTKGSVERCRKCGMTKNFPPNIPNHVYLSFHIKNVLRKEDPRFKKEYPHIKE